MEKKESNRENIQRAQQGSGSAENKGQDRSAQQNKSADVSQQDRQNLAAKMGRGPNPIADVEDLGGLSGRDDASGGSGDRMEGENTGERTER